MLERVAIHKLDVFVCKGSVGARKVEVAVPADEFFGVRLHQEKGRGGDAESRKE